MVIAVLSCMLLARWQWHVSQHTHSLQNLAYALQWPLFGVFFAVMWWRMLRLESLKLDEEDPDTEPAAEEPEGRRRGRWDRPKPPVLAPLLSPPPAPRAADPAEGDAGADDEQLAAYNRMLAELAARDRAS
jgi:DNA-binding transcriptional regulator of glucitol operon